MGTWCLGPPAEVLCATACLRHPPANNVPPCLRQACARTQARALNPPPPPPPSRQIDDMCEYLHITPDDHAWVREVAHMALSAPMPDGWEELEDDTGYVFRCVWACLGGWEPGSSTSEVAGLEGKGGGGMCGWRSLGMGGIRIPNQIQGEDTAPAMLAHS